MILELFSRGDGRGGRPALLILKVAVLCWCLNRASNMVDAQRGNRAVVPSIVQPFAFVFAAQNRLPRWSVAAGVAVSRRQFHCASEGRGHATSGRFHSAVV